MMATDSQEEMPVIIEEVTGSSSDAAGNFVAAAVEAGARETGAEDGNPATNDQVVSHSTAAEVDAAGDEENTETGSQGQAADDGGAPREKADDAAAAAEQETEAAPLDGPLPPPRGAFRLHCAFGGRRFEVVLPPAAEMRAVFALKEWQELDGDAFLTLLRCVVAARVLARADEGGNETNQGDVVVPQQLIGFRDAADVETDLEGALAEAIQDYLRGRIPPGDRDFFHFDAAVVVTSLDLCLEQMERAGSKDSAPAVVPPAGTRALRLFELVGHCEFHHGRRGVQKVPTGPTEVRSHEVFVPSEAMNEATNEPGADYEAQCRVREKVFDVFCRHAKGTKNMRAYESAFTDSRAWAEILLLVYGKDRRDWRLADFEKVAVILHHMTELQITSGSVYKVRGRKVKRVGMPLPHDRLDECIKRTMGSGGRTSSFEGHMCDENFIVERVPCFFYLLFAYAWFLRYECDVLDDEVPKAGLDADENDAATNAKQARAPARSASALAAAVEKAEGDATRPSITAERNSVARGNVGLLLTNVVTRTLGRRLINGGSTAPGAAPLASSGANGAKEDEVFRGFFEGFCCDPREPARGNLFTERAKFTYRGSFLALLLADVLHASRVCRGRAAGECDDDGSCMQLLLAFFVKEGIVVGADLDSGSNANLDIVEQSFFSEHFSACYRRTDEQLAQRRKSHAVDPDVDCDPHEDIWISADSDVDGTGGLEALYELVLSNEADKQALGEWQQQNFKCGPMPAWGHQKGAHLEERSSFIGTLCACKLKSVGVLLDAIGTHSCLPPAALRRLVSREFPGLPTRIPPSATHAHSHKLQRLAKLALQTAPDALQGNGAGFCEGFCALFVKVPLFFECIARENKNLGAFVHPSAHIKPKSPEEKMEAKQADVFFRMEREYSAINTAHRDVIHSQVFALNGLLTGFFSLCGESKGDAGEALAMKTDKLQHLLFNAAGCAYANGKRANTDPSCLHCSTNDVIAGKTGAPDRSMRGRERAAGALVTQCETLGAPGGFLRDLEEYLAGPEIAGWQRLLDEKLSRGKKQGSRKFAAEEDEEEEEREADPRASLSMLDNARPHWQKVNRKGQSALDAVRKLAAINRKLVDEDLHGSGAKVVSDGPDAERMYLHDRPFLEDHTPIEAGGVFSADEFDSFRYGAHMAGLHF